MHDALLLCERGAAVLERVLDALVVRDRLELPLEVVERARAAVRGEVGRLVSQHLADVLDELRDPHEVDERVLVDLDCGRLRAKDGVEVAQVDGWAWARARACREWADAASVSARRWGYLRCLTHLTKEHRAHPTREGLLCTRGGCAPVPGGCPAAAARASPAC